MKGYLTTFARLFEARPEGAPFVKKIEIPLIQRDYAQGRRTAAVDEIRTNFLQVILNATAGIEPAGLDFVYGKVHQGTLQPLDGQQRLTTLFLLHWYMASRANKLESTAPWTRFSYATRLSARRFCERLSENSLPDPLPPESVLPSDWIADQPWFLHGWRDDPTIESMLHMVDAIDREFRRAHPHLDVDAAWDRLNSGENPAISFYLLPLDDMQSEEDLYIKMNSRGMPLTPFETFKARFEEDISRSRWVDDVGRTRADSFAHSIDGAWSELFWKFHGGDNSIDDELLRYIDFLTQICEVREGLIVDGSVGERARLIFGEANDRAEEHLDFLFAAFDCWRNEAHVAEVFDELFSTAPPGSGGYDPGKVILFTGTGTNLFGLCIRHFDSQAKRNPDFTLQQSLLLYAVLLHLIEGTDDFPRRLRVLRNLVAAPGTEVRDRDRMPGLVSDVEVIVRTGSLSGLRRFSANQVADEVRKQDLIKTNVDLAPVVDRLEDHRLLRGTLAAFDVYDASFTERARTFEEAFSDPDAWPRLPRALLALGDYQRPRPRTSDWRFGTVYASNDGPWRDLLVDGSLEELAPTRTVLARFLDGFAASGIGLASYCESLVDEWVASREAANVYDWRYLLIKHNLLRASRPGIVRGEPGYSMLMLRETKDSQINRDPVLLAVWELAGASDRVKDLRFGAYETTPRWLELIQSGAALRNVSEGFALRPPEVERLGEPFSRVCQRRSDVEVTEEGLLLRILQVDGVDTTDRVVIGGVFLQDLLAAGL